MAGEFARSIEAKNITDKTMDMFWNVMFTELYVNYDLNEELIPQFRKNKVKLRDIFVKIEEMANTMLGGA
jgi:NTP pyrophosphatase (non-canonical NTP hydrolase)